jgi:DNA-binding MarR family transcriptional regulator
VSDADGGLTKGSTIPDEELARLGREIIVRVRHVYRDIQTAFDAAVRPYGLTPAQNRLLRVVSHRPRSSAAQIARTLNVTPQAVHLLLRGLADRDLIRGSTVARGTSWELTPAGRRLFEECEAEIDALVLGHLDQFSVARLAMLSDLLEQWRRAPWPALDAI